MRNPHSLSNTGDWDWLTTGPNRLSRRPPTFRLFVGNQLRSFLLPFRYTPVQVHTHKTVHPFSCTPVTFLESSYTLVSSTYFLIELLFLVEKKKDLESLFLFLLILFLYPISIPSSKVTHNGSIHKYTQVVILTHYSPLRGGLPSVTFGHKQNQTISTAVCEQPPLNDTSIETISDFGCVTSWNGNRDVSRLNRDSMMMHLFSQRFITEFHNKLARFGSVRECDILEWDPGC